MAKSKTQRQHSKGMRYISDEDIYHLGYHPGGVIHIGLAEHVSSIFEMLDDDGRQASFCYLQVKGEDHGKILPHPFDHYLGQHSFDLSEYRDHEES